jgi:hypothetical protein
MVIAAKDIEFNIKTNSRGPSRRPVVADFQFIFIFICTSKTLDLNGRHSLLRE